MSRQGRPDTVQPFCPPNFMRYENQNRSEYKTLWTCQICSRCMLSENAVRIHPRYCHKFIQIHTINRSNRNVPSVQPPIPDVIDNDLPIYICDVCQSPFRRHAALATHQRIAHQRILEKNTGAGPSQGPRMLVPPHKIKIENIRANKRLPIVRIPRTPLNIKKEPVTKNYQN